MSVPLPVHLGQEGQNQVIVPGHRVLQFDVGEEAAQDTLPSSADVEMNTRVGNYQWMFVRFARGTRR